MCKTLFPSPVLQKREGKREGGRQKKRKRDGKEERRKEKKERKEKKTVFDKCTVLCIHYYCILHSIRILSPS
jgi:hypothetical protein